MSNAISDFVTLEHWHSDKSGAGRLLFNFGKTIGTLGRFALVFGVTVTVIACVMDTNYLFVASFAAGPFLLLLAFTELVARSLMRAGGGTT